MRAYFFHGLGARMGEESSALVNFLSDPATLVSLGVIAAGTAYYLSTRPAPMRSPFPIDKQSLELTGGEHARGSHYSKNSELMKFRFEDAKTLYEGFQRGKRISNNGPCLGWRPSTSSPYQWITYGQVEQRALAFGSGLCKLEIEPGQDSYVGIYCHNTVDWVVVEQSCHCFSRVIVPLYDTLGPDAIAYIINQACIPVVVCGATKVQILLKQAENCPSLRTIVKMGTISQEEKDQATAMGITLVSMEEVEITGQENPSEPVPPGYDDVSTVCYTSGTTGNPKGVILTHGNVMANVGSAHKHLVSHFEVTNDDVHISYLPLAHMMERVTQALVFMCGARIGFYSGDVKELVNDIQALKPTLFVSVPRLLNRIYDKVMAGVVGASPVKKWLFDRAFASKLSEVRRNIVRRDSIWDWLVFRRVQNYLGGRVRFVLTGSAPIGSRVMDFLRVSFGCAVMEGYGQTESTAGITFTTPGDFSTGHVGPPLSCNFVKLVDVAEMNYFAANGEGEVCAKGTNVFKGYLKDPEKTAEVMDKDGWLHTGDIGKWLPNGTLKIVDRKKHIFKLAQGEYVAPEKVENIYMRSTFVAQAYLYGDSLKSMCVGIIVPDEEVLVAWAKTNKNPSSFTDLCHQEDIKRMILDDITRVGKENGLHSFEQMKAIMLYPEGFSVENGLLTPTFKLKRPALKTQFMENFVQLYHQLPS